MEQQGPEDGAAGTNVWRLKAGNRVRDQPHTWGTGDDNHVQSPSPSCPQCPTDHLPGLGLPQRFMGRIKTLQSFLLSSSLPLTHSNTHTGTSRAGARSLQDPVAPRGRSQPGDKSPRARGMACSRRRLLPGPTAEAEPLKEQQKIWEAKYFMWVAAQRAIKSLINTAIIGHYFTVTINRPSCCCCCCWFWVASQCSHDWV